MKSQLLRATALVVLFAIQPILHAQAPDWMWAHRAGNSGYEYGNSITADAAGNNFATGMFNTSIMFDANHTLYSAGSGDIYILKSDAAGNVIWAKGAGGSLEDRAMGIALDDQGNCYVAGYFKSANLVFGTYTLVNAGGNTYDVFVAKYDPDGNVVWATSAGGTGDDRAYSVSVSGEGNVFIAGYFVSSSITFGSTTLNNSGNVDLFVAKYNTAGTASWAATAFGAGPDYATSVAAGPEGSVYLAGYFKSSTLNFGTSILNLTNISFFDLFLVKFDADGEDLWAHNAEGNLDEMAYTVTVDEMGNAITAGYFKSPVLTLGDIELVNAGSNTEDIFIVKTDTEGDLIWAKSFGGTSGDGIYAAATDPSGNNYFTGYFKSSSISFGTTTLTNQTSGTGDIMLVSLTPAGDERWAKSAIGTGEDYGSSIALDASANCYVTGTTSSTTLSFGDIALNSIGTTDIFIVKADHITGIPENGSAGRLAISPNPASSDIRIETPVPCNIHIRNIHGQVILSFSSSEAAVTLSIDGLVNGIYLVEIESAGEHSIAKFIKQ